VGFELLQRAPTQRDSLALNGEQPVLRLQLTWIAAPADSMDTRPMSKKEDTYSDDELHLHAGYVALFTLFLAIVALGAYMWRFGSLGISDKTSAWNEFGGYIGGVIGPIVGLATVFLVFITFTLQRRELQASLAEMRRANKSTAIQSFEQSLFAWLSTYHALIATARVNELDHGRAAMSYWYRRHFAGRRAWHAWANVNLYSYEYPENADEKDIDAALKEVASNLQNEAGRPQLEEIFRYALEGFENVYRDHRSDFDAAFRTLYRLLKWVDGADLTLEQKWHYAALVRAQLSWIEQVFLLYSTLTPAGASLAELINKYALFDNLDLGADVLIRLIALELTPRPPGNFSTVKPDMPWPFAEAAFKSATAKSALNLN
jgi:hypothetical protein